MIIIVSLVRLTRTTRAEKILTTTHHVEKAKKLQNKQKIKLTVKSKNDSLVPPWSKKEQRENHQHHNENYHQSSHEVNSTYSLFWVDFDINKN